MAEEDGAGFVLLEAQLVVDGGGRRRLVRLARKSAVRRETWKFQHGHSLPQRLCCFEHGFGRGPDAEVFS